jgi:hypothetical protein
MSKPRFANKWYQTPPVNELRQEIQNVYDELTDLEIDSGSGDNGYYIKHPDGTLECWHTLTLTQVGTSVLTATWKFPVEFVGTPVVSHEISATGRSITPTVDELGQSYHQDETTTSVSLRLIRIAGMTNFSASDTITTYARAIGKWQ